MCVEFTVTDFVLNTNKVIKEKDISMNELSNKSGISKGVLTAVLNGYYGPLKQHLIGLSKALDVKIADLIKTVE